jgi:hypothetical protein
MKLGDMFIYSDFITDVLVVMIPIPFVSTSYLNQFSSRTDGNTDLALAFVSQEEDCGSWSFSSRDLVS